MQPKIIFSKRRSIALMVTPAAEVIIRAPYRTPRGYIDKFVQEKLGWIEKALARRKQQPKKQYATGELFLYLGNQYPLIESDEYRSRLHFENAFYISRHKIAFARSSFEAWYLQQAKIILAERIKHFAAKMGLKYKRISVKSMSSRWGSCSSLGNLNFNFKLAMAPLEVIDYVVVHELSHLTHKNHSGKFWQLVQQYHPSAPECRKWLRRNGNALVF